MMNHQYQDGISFARKLDAEDPLRGVRDRFYMNDGEIYMDGNSLGLCSRDAEQSVLHALDVWKKSCIGIWNVEDSKYFLYPSALGSLIAPLLGADPEEVTVTNSTTVNIHQAIGTFYSPTPERYKILVDDLNFPTDRYAVDSLVRTRGYDPAEAVKVVQSRDGRFLDEEDIIAAMSGDVALILLPSVLYRSAQLLDMKRLTDEAHRRGIVIGWDLCHSIGSVPHDFRKIDPDFAIWCNYKYLNGGPGATAGLFINRRFFKKDPGMAGWFGNVKETQFQLNQQYVHAQNADGWLTGTPHILSMAGIEGSLKIFQEVGMARIREKSLKLTGYLMFLIDTRLTKLGYAVGNPRDDTKRGGHVALEHAEAYRICQALKAHKVVPDFREPNVIRLAPVALYTSFEEILRLVDILEQIAGGMEYERYSDRRTLVV